MTLGDPQQRPHRIAKRCRLDQAAQIRQERRILLLHGLAPAAGTTDLARRQSRLIQVGKPPPDCAAGNPGGTRHGGDAAVAGRARFGRCHQAQTAFIELPAHRFEALSEACFVNHPMR